MPEVANCSIHWEAARTDRGRFLVDWTAAEKLTGLRRIADPGLCDPSQVTDAAGAENLGGNQVGVVVGGALTELTIVVESPVPSRSVRLQGNAR